MIARIMRMGRHWLQKTTHNGIRALYRPERDRLNRLFGPLLEGINARIENEQSRVYHLVYLFASAPDQDRPMKVLYAAREDVDWDENLRYVSYLLFGDDRPQTSERVTCTARQLRKRVEAMKAGCDLVCVDANRSFIWRPQAGEWVISPQQVRMVVDFEPGESWEQVEKRFRSHRGNLRLVRRLGLSHRYGTEEDLEFFYNRMYLPLVKDRYAQFAYIDRKKTLRDWLRRGELLFMVDAAGRDVAASLNINQGRVKFMMVNGVLDADPELIRNGALSAIYYTCIRNGFKEGFSRCDFGDTRPFEDDGVYRHKQRWGMTTVSDPWAVNRWLFWSPNGSPFARRWLREKPFVRSLARYGGFSPDAAAEAASERAPTRNWQPAEPEPVEDSKG